MAKKYSISETTRVQREKIANNALALSTLNAPEPSADTLELVDECVKGNVEINDVLQKTIERYGVSASPEQVKERLEMTIQQANLKNIKRSKSKCQN